MGPRPRREGRGLILTGRDLSRDPTSTLRRSADYHRCMNSMTRRGKSTQPCEYYFRVYRSLCPISWVRGRRGAWWRGWWPQTQAEQTLGALLPLQVQRWNEQIKQGTFPGKI